MSSFNYKQVSHQLEKHLNLNRSEKLALKYSFEMVIDEEAYNGRYFIKDGKMLGRKEFGRRAHSHLAT